MTLLLNRELVSRVKLCMFSVLFPDTVKDCPKLRNLPEIFLRSFENVACGSPSSTVLHVTFTSLLGNAIEAAVVDEVEHCRQQGQRSASDRHPETPVEVHVRRGAPVDAHRR